MNNRYPVFVYGTLKRGFPNYDAELLDQFYKCPATTLTCYPLLVANQWYSPVVVMAPGEGHPIQGELFEVSSTVFDWMDELEGIHLEQGYRRHLTTVVSGQSQTSEAWIYTKTWSQIDVVHAGPLTDYQDRRYLPLTDRPK